MLSMVQRVFFGPITRKGNLRLSDINNREVLAVAPLIMMIFVIGLFPRIFLDPMRDAVSRVGGDYSARLAASPGPKYYVGPIKLFARSPDAPAAIGPSAEAPFAP
jgi:NADH-quinone oxidoreductase subunit M